MASLPNMDHWPRCASGWRRCGASVRTWRALVGRCAACGRAAGDRGAAGAIDFCARSGSLPPFTLGSAFMGQYHSRFVDLPVPLATDLVQLWDRPPTTDSRTGRLWLSLARATLALREGGHEEAEQHFAAAAASAAGDAAGQIEVALGGAFLDSHACPQEMPAALAAVPGLLAEVTGPDADCLRARYAGQLAHAPSALLRLRVAPRTR